MKYLCKRLLSFIPVLIGISLVAFLVGIIMPGDPAAIALSAGGNYSPSHEQIEIERARMGLDKPYAEQYISWLKNVLKGDLGKSFGSKAPVMEELKLRFPNTVKLAILSIVISTIIGVSTGIISVIHKNKIFDDLQQFLSILFVSLPGFWIAIILISIFSEKLGLLPTSGMGSFKHYIMPSITLSLGTIGHISRLTRATLLNEIDKQYITVAKSKGLKNRLIIIKHAFRNSLIPIVATIGNDFGGLLGGSVIVETVFAINGIGKLAMDSIGVRDYPVLQGYVLITGFTYVVMNLIVDIIYYFINPSIKLGENNE